MGRGDDARFGCPASYVRRRFCFKLPTIRDWRQSARGISFLPMTSHRKHTGGDRKLADQRYALLYEHRPWIEPLLERLGERGLTIDPLPVRRMLLDPAIRDYPYALVVNRVSAFPGGTGNPRVIFTVLAYLSRLESSGIPVLNGYHSFSVATSKVRQVGILSDLGLRVPRTIALHRTRQLPEAAEDLTLPLIIKPNVGGSGVGIRLLETASDVRAAARDYTLDTGPDGVCLLQEYHRPWGDQIVRVEMLQGELLYGVRQRIAHRVFNYCAIGGHNAARGPLGLERFTPPPEVVAAAADIMQRAASDFGSVEYLVSERDGERYYFDINPYSNYAPADVVGFDPLDRLADAIVRAAVERCSKVSVPHG